jgi:hypothetical protein
LANYFTNFEDKSKQIYFSLQNINLFRLFVQSLNSGKIKIIIYLFFKARNVQLLSAEQNFIRHFVNTLNALNYYLITCKVYYKYYLIKIKEFIKIFIL